MQRYLIIAAAMLVAVTLTTAVQADIIDQDNTVDPGGGGGTISIDFTRSQTVTVGVSGQLSRIGLQVQRGVNTTDNLNIRLLGTTGGSPDGSNVLATSFLTPSEFSVGPGVGSVPVVFADFLADGLTFNAGDMFAIELSSDAPTTSAAGARYIWLINGGYVGGQDFRNGAAQSSDRAFQTFVVVPEPTSASLLALGGFVFLRRRQRQRVGS